MSQKANQRKPLPKPIPVKAAAKPAAVPEQKPAFVLSVTNLCFILAAFAFILYFNTLWNGYVMDDVIVLKENRIVMKGISAIPELFRTPHMLGYMTIPNDMYRPLSMAMFAIEYQFFGANPAVNHFFNILVFIGCVVMLFLFLDKFFEGKKTPVAFLAALIFAAQPLHTEVVANIKSRDELLCFFFAFWSLYLFMGYMNKGKIGLLAGGIFTLFLSFLSKETVITFIGIIPLIFFLYNNKDRKKAIFITIGTLAVAGLFLAIRASVLSAYHANQPAPIDFIDNALAKSAGIERFATEVVILGRYLWLQFIPYPLLSTYSFSAIPFASLASPLFWLSLVAYIFLAYMAVTGLVKNKKDPWAFAILFFIASLSLFSNIPFLMGAEMAERFAFFASAGFCMAAALAIEKWAIKDSASGIRALKSTKVMAVMLPMLLIFSVMTIARNADWKDNYTLYKADIQKSPENSRLYHYLATAIAEDEYPNETDSLKRRDMDLESIGYLRKGLEIYPAFTEARVELGRIYDRNRMYDSAIAEDKLALAISPNHSTANNNLGSVYLTTGRYQDAIVYFRKSIEVNPNFAYAYLNMARACQQLKQYDSAVAYFTKTLRFGPDYYFEAHNQMGLLYFFMQQYDSSATHLKQALALKPDDPNVISTLGAVYLNSKNYPEAIEITKKSLSLNPGNTTALSNLGRAYYLNNQFPQAIETFTKELAADPKSPRDVPYLALAYQKAGNMDMARKYEALARQAYADFRLQ